MIMRSFFKRMLSTAKRFRLAKGQMMRSVSALLAIVALLLTGSAVAHMSATPTGLGTIYNVDFEVFTVGSPLPADSSGEVLDRPHDINSNLIATVEDNSTVPEGTPTVNSTKFVRLMESCGEAPNLAFDSGTAVFSGIAHVAVDVLFENLENYQIVFRNGRGSGIPGPASQTVADIDMHSNGTMRFSSTGGTVNIGYQAGVPIHIDTFFDLTNYRWHAFVNGDRVVNGLAILNSPLGFVGIGFDFTNFCPSVVGFDGAMQFDNFLFEQVTAIPVVAPAPTISTVASGLNFPFGVAVDPLYGDVYIADRNNHKVWKLTGGTLTAVAGTGEAGYNGDNILARSALLDSPTGVAVDESGNLFIADSGNHIIRKVSSSGMISTVAGTPQKLGLAVNGGPATSATLFGPRGVATDGAGNLYIADTMNQQIRKVDFATGNITAVAGIAGETGAADGPVSCPPASECIPARLNSPLGVAVDPSGSVVYIADEGNDKIRIVNVDGVSTVAAGALNSPSGVAVANGTLYIADTDNHRIRRVSGEVITTVAGTGTAGFSGDEGPATAAQLDSPVAVAVDATGRFLLIADLINQRIRKVDLTPTP